MMGFVGAAWEQIYGLLVEDGQIAIGTLLAFIAVAAYSFLAGEGDMRNAAGWILFVLLMSLLLVNLYTTGRKAHARRTTT